MKEYVEREAALVEIRNLYPGIPFVKALRQRWHEDNKAYMMCENAVNAIPAADVEKVRHGRWIFDFSLGGSSFYKCSKCGRQECILEKYSAEAYMPYCHCGAKMDGGADN